MGASKNSKAIAKNATTYGSMHFKAAGTDGSSISGSTGHTRTSGSSANAATSAAAPASIQDIDWQPDEDLFFKSRLKFASFFRQHRLDLNMSLEQVRDSLNLKSTEDVIAYESGARPIPLEDMFSLTNLLNIPPEEVLALIVDTTSQQGLR